MISAKSRWAVRIMFPYGTGTNYSLRDKLTSNFGRNIVISRSVIREKITWVLYVFVMLKQERTFLMKWAFQSDDFFVLHNLRNEILVDKNIMSHFFKSNVWTTSKEINNEYVRYMSETKYLSKNYTGWQILINGCTYIQAHNNLESNHERSLAAESFTNCITLTPDPTWKSLMK